MAEALTITLRQLQAFLAVAASGSFTRAAEQLHVTQAGLSAMVRELETQLDCQLFERTTRQVELTPAAHHLRPVAERSVNELRDVVAELRQQGTASQQRLRVGCTPLIAASVMPLVLQQMQTTNEALQLELFDAERQHLARALHDGELDVALGAFFERMAGLRRETVLPSELMLVQAEPSVHKSLPWQAVHEVPLITLPPENPLQRLVDRCLGPDHARSRQAVRHLETVLALVAAGHGQAVMPSFARLASQYSELSWIPLRPRVACDYQALTRAGARPGKALQLFLTTFRSVCEPQLRPTVE